MDSPIASPLVVHIGGDVGPESPVDHPDRLSRTIAKTARAALLFARLRSKSAVVAVLSISVLVTGCIESETSSTRGQSVVLSQVVDDVAPPRGAEEPTRTSPAEVESCGNGVSLGSRPSALAESGGDAWVASEPDREGAHVFRVADDEAIQVAEVGISPTALIVDQTARLWVANGSGLGPVYGSPGSGPGFPLENSLQIIPATGNGEITFLPIEGPLDMMRVGESVYVLTDNELIEVSVNTLKTDTRIPLPEHPSGDLHYGQGLFWIPLDFTDAFFTADPQDNTTEVRSAPARNGIGFADGAAWVIDQAGVVASLDDTRPAIEPADSHIYLRILAGGGRAILVSDASNRLVSVDVATGRQVSVCQFSGPPVLAQLSSQGLWVATESAVIHLEDVSGISGE